MRIASEVVGRSFFKPFKIRHPLILEYLIQIVTQYSNGFLTGCYEDVLYLGALPQNNLTQVLQCTCLLLPSDERASPKVWSWWLQVSSNLHTHYYYCTYLLSKSKLPFNRNPWKIALGLKFGQILVKINSWIREKSKQIFQMKLLEEKFRI